MKIKKEMTSVLLVLIILLSTPLVLASSVTRSITPDSASPGDIITVDLDVFLDNNEQFYSMEETFPSGWTVTDPGIGVVGADGVWRIVQGPTPPPPQGLTTHMYQVQVPPGANGVFPFSGEFGFVDGGTVAGPIAGESTVTVSGGAGTVISVVPNTQTVNVGYASTI